MLPHAVWGNTLHPPTLEIAQACLTVTLVRWQQLSEAMTNSDSSHLP